MISGFLIFRIRIEAGTGRCDKHHSSTTGAPRQSAKSFQN
jgi:hypothetical protein